MKNSILFALHGLVSLRSGCAAPAAAQRGPVEVAFEVPLNLTRLPAQITEIKLQCQIQSSAFDLIQGVESRPSGRRGAELIIPVAQGEVVQTAQVVIPLNGSDFVANASGSAANYECVLYARNTSNSQPWIQFSQGTYHYQLTPAPAPITGSFVW